ncbi:MAG: hypothetical protein M3N29_01950 [Chloroflexota bacterium]|nr:hypothetical protein [Chloroflexota bacterium]
MRYTGQRSELDAPLVRVANALRLAFVPLVVVAVLQGEPWMLVALVVGAGVALLPLILERVRPAALSGVVHLAAVALPLADLAGRTLHLYESSELPYDVFSHGVGVASATALLLLFAAARLDSLGWRHKPVAIAVVGGVIGLAIAVGWELVELGAEPLFSGTLQHGLDDTLLDVVAGLAGAVAASLIVVLYWRAEKSPAR